MHHRAVVAARQRQVGLRVQRQRVTGKNAGRPGSGRQVHPRVIGCAVHQATGHSVAVGTHTGHAVGRIEITQLRALAELHPAGVQGRTQHRLLLNARPGTLPVELAGDAGVVLVGGGPVDQAIALFSGLVSALRIGNAAPFRKRGIAGVFARGREAGVAGGRQRRLLGGIGLVDRLVECRLVDIAIEGRGLDAAVVDLTGQRQAVAQQLAGGQVDQQRAVAGGVGLGVDTFSVSIQQSHLLQTVAVEGVVGQCCCQPQPGVSGQQAELAEQLADVAGRLAAPAFFMEAVAGDKPVQALGTATAGLELQRHTLVLAGQQLHHTAGVLEPVLGLHRQRATQGVEAKQRVGPWHQDHAGDGRLRDQIPADDIAKRLVQPHAVQVHRQALRAAQQRRRGETPVVDIGLKRVALQLIDMHAAELARHECGQINCVAALEVSGTRRLHVGRQPVFGQVQAGHRADANHLDLLRYGLGHCGAG